MTAQTKGHLARNYSSNSTVLEPSRDIGPYGLANRPYKILDALHEVVSRTTDILISFYPLIDTIHLLVPKPIALSFFCATGHSRRKFVHVYTTFPEDQPLDDFLRRFGTNGFAKLAGNMIEIPRPAGSRSDKFYLLVSAVKRNASAIEPYREAAVASVSGRHHLPPNSNQAQDIWLFRRLFDELRADATQPLSKRTLEVLNRNLSQRRQALQDSKEKKGKPPVERAHAETKHQIEGEHTDDAPNKWPEGHREFGEFIRPMLDEALSDIWDVEPLRAEQNTPFPNLFCVFRYALPPGQHRGGFTYDARIVLARHQCQKIDEWLMHKPIFKSYSDLPGMDRRSKNHLFRSHFRSDAQRVRSTLEEPVSRHFRSISDTVFQSGLIDFSDEISFGAHRSTRHSPIEEPRGSPRSSDTAVDEERKKAEALILGQHGLNLFYVPVHIGGVPWISLFSMNNDSGRIDSEVWRSQYHLYRGLIPAIAANLRRLGQHYYRKALAVILEDVLAGAKSANVFDALNRRWAHLTTFFPYPQVWALPAQGKQLDFRMPDEGHPTLLELRPNLNPCFVEGKLAFDTLDEMLLKETLQSVANRVTSENANRSRALQLGGERERIDVAHSSKNMMNSITSLIRAAKKDLLEPELNQENLWNAEQYSLFIGQDYGVLQRMMEMASSDTGGDIAPILARLTNAQLIDLVELCVRYITAVSQIVYSENRQYFVGGKPVTGVFPSDILETLKSRIQSIYDSWNLDYTSGEWEFRADPLFCTMFFIFREIVDNTRPRLTETASEGPQERYFDLQISHPLTASKTGRVLTFVQRAPRGCKSSSDSPFLGADRAASVDRFNRRYGMGSVLRLAEIRTMPPRETDDWYIFELTVVFGQ